MDTIKILIPDGEAIAALNEAYCLKNAGFDCEVLVATTSSRSVSRFSRFIDKVCRISPGQEVEELCRVIEKEKIDVLLPTAVRDINLVSRNKTVFQALCTIVAVPTTHQLNESISKYAFSQQMVQNDIPIPETYRLDKLPEVFSNLSLPLIVKPVCGSGGIGIRRIDTQSELQKLVTDEQDHKKDLIVQSYIEGHDVDCSVFCIDGEIKAYTVQRAAQSSGRLYRPSPSIDFIHDETVVKLSARVMKAHHFNGVAHIDLRYDDLTGELFVIEINPRYWASVLGSFAAGINVPVIAVSDALGLDYDPPMYRECRFVRFFTWLRQFPYGSKNIRETNLKYMICDPLPRLINKIRRAV